jgi:hypothetical protein
MHRRSIIALALVTLLTLSVPVSAHHGAAAYDLATTSTFDAVVTSFKWINPHGLLEFDVRDDHGQVQHWTAETAGLTILVRAGWSKTVIAPGERITISGHPAHNRTPTMILDRVVLADGRLLTNFVPRK